MRVLLLLCLIPILLAGSCEKEKPAVNGDRNPHYRVMFYNVENLFDAEDDPLINDSEFQPGSEKKWTVERYHDKLDKIARIIGEVGQDTLPILVGLCEIENRRTLDDLIALAPLANQDYRIVHRESPDYRGIDVALLYRANYFNLLSQHFFPVWFPFDSAVRTREILYAKGVLGGKDTVHVFVNHWPSRSSGEVESRPLRAFVASAVRARVDSILAANNHANIVITGDFNDEPQDLSVVSALRALLTFQDTRAGELYDLTALLKSGFPGGTYKYKGNWNLLDHMVISGSLMDTTRSLYARTSDIHVFAPSRILEEDKEYMGDRPIRTYLGPYYHGGYSDHLPVYLDIHYRR